MPLVTRKRTIKVAIETVKGTKVAGTLPIVVTELLIDATAPYEKRGSSGVRLGNDLAGTLGERSGECSFTCELLSTGVAALDAGLAALLQASSFKNTIETYNCNSVYSDNKTLSIDVWEDGVKKGLSGASANVTIEGEFGKPATLKFEFMGIWQEPVDEAMPAFVLPATIPMKMSGFTLDSNSVKISTYSLNMQNAVKLREDAGAVIGICEAMITDFDPALTIDPEAQLVAGYDYFGLWLSGTEKAVAMIFTDGTDTVTITLPKVVNSEIKGADRDGIITNDFTGQCNHSSGDDAVTLVVT